MYLANVLLLLMVFVVYLLVPYVCIKQALSFFSQGRKVTPTKPKRQ